MTDTRAAEGHPAPGRRMSRLDVYNGSSQPRRLRFSWLRRAVLLAPHASAIVLGVPGGDEQPTIAASGPGVVFTLTSAALDEEDGAP